LQIDQSKNASKHLLHQVICSQDRTKSNVIDKHDWSD